MVSKHNLNKIGILINDVFRLALALIVIGVGLYAIAAGIQNPYALAQENLSSIDVNITNNSDFLPSEKVSLTTNQSLSLGQNLTSNENMTGNISGMRYFPGGKVLLPPVNKSQVEPPKIQVEPPKVAEEIQVEPLLGNKSQVEPPKVAEEIQVEPFLVNKSQVKPPKVQVKPPTGDLEGALLLADELLPPPKVVRLRIQVVDIQVYKDHDGSSRGDGEWHLFGVVSCCGGAANSNMPTNVYSFNAPGAKEGEIDTPSNDMNDVTGERRGHWGTVETVKFNNVWQDFDVDNTNPLTEINMDFFGIEDDKITASDLPPIPDNTGNVYVEAAKYISKLSVYFNNLDSVDQLGKVHNQFTKANNYGVGFHSAASDLNYKNVWYKSQAIETQCQTTGWKVSPPPICNVRQDWPDFPDYIISYMIIDRDNRCALGFTYNYALNICKPVVIS